MLTTYHLSVGGLLSLVKIPSVYRVHVGEEHAEGIGYSILSLITGWWALPEGPLVTINFIAQNLHGGEQISVALLIDEKLLKRKMLEDFQKQEESLAEEKELQDGHIEKFLPPCSISRHSVNR